MECGEREASISIRTDAFDTRGYIEAAKRRATGAIVVFVGVVRDDGIESIEIEAYEEVAVRDLHEIRDDAVAKFDLQEVTIIHRTGTLQVGDDILLIVVSAAHRSNAFAGCEYILERIKERAPIWKREILGCGDRWVKGNTE
ncbi:MAG: molybdopterin guanine dinucleotide biosynthesis protein MoaE [Methanoregulaceae archaeon PtaB.Bin152]|nr:MAG: molybdopterin guanine dinucleotide biosynthesis protein MoaE [Methanoregulaceae archaeon PtaB.Bin152]